MMFHAHTEMSAAENHACCLVCGAGVRPVFAVNGWQYSRCSRCRSLVTLPVPSQAQIDSHYASKFGEGNYKLLLESAHSYRRIYEDYLAFIRTRFCERGRDLAGRKILDIGCFTGAFLDIAAGQGQMEVYGLELQPEAVEIAQRRFAGRVRRSTLEDTPDPPCSYDVIAMFGVIEHVRDPMDFMSRAVRLLSPGGLLIIETPDAGSCMAKLLGRLWPPIAPVEHICIQTSASIRGVLEKHGFENIQVRPHVKWLPLSYVYPMLRHFGPQWRILLSPLMAILPERLVKVALPFYVGEMIVTAWKRS